MLLLTDEQKWTLGPSVVALGMFDGVHLGHRAVIDMALQSARRSGGLAGVLTFTPHPTALLRPDNPTRLIHDLATKTRLLAETGVDVIITQHFTPAFALVEAEDFLPLLLTHLPRLATLHAGENWRFGRARRGDIAMLVAQAKQRHLAVVSAPRVNENGEPISSTRIRASLQAGEIDHANIMLGYNYFADGVVTPGKALGRTLGFPTLNIAWEPDLRPRFGVYAVRVTGETSPSAPRHSGPSAFQPFSPSALSFSLPGVANYGLRPTVEQTAAQPRLETHLLGLASPGSAPTPCPFGAGDKIRVEWLHFLRPETKFPTPAALATQIARDRADAEKFFQENE